MLSLLFYLSMLETEEERSKFAQIYDLYKGLMLHVANDILHDFHEANDIVHDAFIKLTNYMDKIEEVDCHKTKVFVVVITESVSINRYNKRKREKAVSLDDLDNEIPDLTDIGNSVLQKMTVEFVLDKLKQLPEIYNTVLSLRYIYEKSDKEIADILGISHSAVRKRLERARILLLKECGESE